MSQPVKVIIAGAGGRGFAYAAYALAHPDRLQVVGVAEPRDYYRDKMAQAHHLPDENVFTDWRDMAARERFADAVLVCTQDAMHRAPAEAFVARGYHLLLEKPMAPSPEDCRAIVAAVRKAGVLFGVCHVMRYTKYTQRLKALVDEGRIGELVTMQHLEPVGFWHQAHSFVRGNWCNEAESSFMLLAKSCHDLDWMRYFVGAQCQAVSSFGGLYHFRKSQQPPGASARCLDCAVEADCPYSAVRQYLGAVKRGETGWPLNVITSDLTVEGVTEALRSGPYGRCVYECDNDVVDHQTVNLQFAGGQTAVFTMTAFNAGGNRKTRLFGTRGEIYGDGRYIECFDFLTRTTQVIDVDEDSDGTILSGHGGGDYGIMDAFVKAVAENNPRHILSGPDETLESHLIVFAAEQARREERVVKM